MKKLYKVKSKEHLGYDTYDEFVCVAENELMAMCIHPDEDYSEIAFNPDEKSWGNYQNDVWVKDTWRSYSWLKDPRGKVDVEYLAEYHGEHQVGHIITASFNAG